MSGETAYELGETSGRRFRESVETQLSPIAQKLGVNVASLGDGGVGEYGRGVGPYGRGGGISKRGAGQRGGRRTGGGETHQSAEKPYHGEPVLGEDEAPTGDAAKALREGFKGAHDTEARIKHGAGTEAEGTPGAVRDPEMAREFAAHMAARDPN